MDIDYIVDKLDAHKLTKKNKVVGDWYSIYYPFHSDGEVLIC